MLGPLNQLGARSMSESIFGFSAQKNRPAPKSFRFFKKTLRKMATVNLNNDQKEKIPFSSFVLAIFESNFWESNQI